jgi:hypothetical protein
MNCLASGIQADDAHHLMTAETRRGSSTLNVWKNSARMSINWVYLWPSDIVSLCSSNFSRSGGLTTLDGNDWVLVLDLASAKLPPPGKGSFQ